ncbi:MAG: hypothetical protein IKR57_06530 [Bacilli bacterium]|nr:hypothetical protein [Bacilli bacterium]
MENNELNSLLLGKIGGNFKTYMESSIISIYGNDIICVAKYDYKLYIDKNNELKTSKSIPEGCKEVVILNLFPVSKDYSEFLVEIIEKSVLLRHLQEERRIIEDIRQGLVHEGGEILC